jgi:hypothetical protein
MAFKRKIIAHALPLCRRLRPDRGELRMSSADLEALIRQGPHAADELPKMLTALGIDQDDWRAASPSFSMERVNTLCCQKRRCDHDLAAGTSAAHYLIAPTRRRLMAWPAVELARVRTRKGSNSIKGASLSAMPAIATEKRTSPGPRRANCGHWLARSASFPDGDSAGACQAAAEGSPPAGGCRISTKLGSQLILPVHMREYPDPASLFPV